MREAMGQVLSVGIGGFVGSVLRFLLHGAVQRMTPGWVLPAGTLVVNLGGCFVIGIIAGATEGLALGSSARSFVFVGLLGGFTTYSTFGYETFALLRGGAAGAAAASVGLHLVAGLAAVWLGFGLGKAGG